MYIIRNAGYEVPENLCPLRDRHLMYQKDAVCSVCGYGTPHMDIFILDEVNYGIPPMGEGPYDRYFEKFLVNGNIEYKKVEQVYDWGKIDGAL